MRSRTLTREAVVKRLIIVASRYEDAYRLAQIIGLSREQWKCPLGPHDVYGYHENRIAIVRMTPGLHLPSKCVSRLRMYEIMGARTFDPQDIEAIREWVAA